MPTVTLRLPERQYRLFQKLAREENRTVSNYIETAALRHVEQAEYADTFEMEEIRKNDALNRSLKKGYTDARLKKGQFVE
jgi:uncharacterized protein (DUF1778 family)